MNSFIVYPTDDIVKIVIHSLEKKKDIQKLLEELKEDRIYEIDILNIKIIPSELIIRFEKLKKNIKRLSSNEKRLVYYLKNLGFNITLDIKKRKFFQIKKESIIKYVGLGGSAGSLEKFIEIVKRLPKSDWTFFVVMHQRRDKKSSLAEILQRYTKNYDVVLASSDIQVMPSTIYVAPPNKHIIVVGGYIFLTDDEERNFSKPSISTTFESLSLEYKEQFMAVLVCGYGSDGSDCLKTIRQNNSLVIIEQLYECLATPMLENAIKTKEYDAILSVYDISRFIHEKMKKEKQIEKYLDELLEDIYNIYGYDYRHYDKKHILRRVEYFFEKNGFSTFIEFKNKVLNDKDFFKEMFLDISINVTTFFRNPKTFKKIKKIIKDKLKDKTNIKIWCAGCSSGEEPYSIAIMLKELKILHKTLIYATDINDIIISQAKNALYPKNNFNLFRKNYKEAGGEFELDYYFNEYEDFIHLKKEIRERILFFKHNLVMDGALNEFNLIFCRNVMIYFDNIITKRVINLFYESLENNGILVIGESEFLNDDNFKVISKERRIYQKVE